MSFKSFSISIARSLGILSATAALGAPVFAQAPPTFTPQGRPTAGVQVGTPTPDVVAGVTFEKNRIKRTPQLLPKTALSESRWDLLYAVTEPTGPKASYFDWDSDYLYFAWESPKPEAVRIDLDGSDDGFLRGADNVSIQLDVPVSLDPDAFSTAVPVSVKLLDGTKNGDQPLQTAAALPTGAVNAVAGRTSTGSYVVMVAIAKTELVGIPRVAGRAIGVRFESGVPVAAPDGTLFLSNRPFVHLVLNDRIEAKEQNVRVSLKILSEKDLVPGDSLRAVLEATNEGTTAVTLTRLFVRGSQASLSFVDSASFTGLALAPGKTTKRELRSIVAPQTPVGTHVITGGAEWTVETGAATAAPVMIAALASFDRVEPYAISMAQPKAPVLTSPDRSIGGSQTVTVTLISRIADTARAEVALKLPLGWSVEGVEGTNRTVVLRGDGDVRALRYKLQVPASTAPGQYVVESTAKFGDTTYSSAATIVVKAAPEVKAESK